MGRILFVTTSIGFAGASKMLCFIAESLAARGYEVGVADMQETTNQRLLSENIRYFSIKSDEYRFVRRVDSIRLLNRVCRAYVPDLLVGFKQLPNFLVSVVGKMRRIPSIMSERGDPFVTDNKSILGRLITYCINHCDGGVFQLEGAKTYYCRHLQNASVVIPNPIFLEPEFRNKTSIKRNKTVVTVGRLNNFQKRYDILFEAFGLFSKSHPNYILRVFGDGCDLEKIKCFAEDYGIKDRVLFMGITKTPMMEIVHDGMFVITSDFEGISNSMLEAMAAGLPVVSTDSSPGGARMVITDHENGLLVPCGNPVAVAAAMSEFADNEALAEKCGKNAEGVLTAFAPDRIVDMWENYIKQFIR